MSYSLSFSEEFFTDETFPYDTRPSKRPTNVYQAIISMPKSELRQISKKFFSIDAKAFGFWSRSESWAVDILDMVRQTNTCSNITTPVEVWIDPRGDYRVRVYDSEEEAQNLDAMSVSELLKVSRTAKNRDLQAYAANTAAAMKLREKGRIAEAETHERAAESFYRLLPKHLKW